MEVPISDEISGRSHTFGSKDTNLSNIESNFDNALEGDVVLHFRNLDISLDHRYRCSRDLLRQASCYFDVLFDPTKFQEGRQVQCELHGISKNYLDLASVPMDKLPVVVVKDIGDIPARENHRQTALHLFLKMIHEPKASRTEADQWMKGSAHALSLVTLLAIIADRFEAKEKIAKHVKRMDKKLFEDGKRDCGPKQKEINRRKRLLVGILLEFPDWVRPASASLICEGSECWMPNVLQSDIEMNDCGERPLWWRLPGGMEEELQCRREQVLETISSLPNHFIGLYTGKQLQCKLGYDSSFQCDSYQLGEMVRFFARKGLSRTQCTYIPSDEHPLYAGDVGNVINKLRQCPSYQLDSNHRHCGLRTRLLPLLDTLWPHGQVGICLTCWNSHRDTESWLENCTRGIWVFSKSPLLRWETCPQHHQLKAMYTAEERRWTPSSS